MTPADKKANQILASQRVFNGNVIAMIGRDLIMRYFLVVFLALILSSNALALKSSFSDRQVQMVVSGSLVAVSIASGYPWSGIFLGAITAPGAPEIARAAIPIIIRELSAIVEIVREELSRK